MQKTITIDIEEEARALIVAAQRDARRWQRKAERLERQVAEMKKDRREVSEALAAVRELANTYTDLYYG